MVHVAVRELTRIGHNGVAWTSLFRGVTTASRFGIKINRACGDVPTHPEVVNAIIDGLLMMDLDGDQLSENRMIVYDLDLPDPSHVTAAAGEPYNPGTDRLEEIELVEIDASLPTSMPEGGRRDLFLQTASARTRSKTTRCGDLLDRSNKGSIRFEG